jgi:hypothetical protein
MRLKRLDSKFNMGVDVMRPAFNLEPHYRVTLFTREERTRGPGTPPVVRGLVWFTDGSRTTEGIKAGVCGQSLGRRLSISIGKHATVFQIVVYAILTCVYEIQMNARPEKFVSICSDSQAALKALQSAKTTSLLVQQCQKALNDISTEHTVGPFGFLDILGYQEMKLPASSQEMVLFQSILDLKI